MKFVIIAILVALVAADIHPVNHSIVNEIKAKATTWTPMEPEENPFAYMTSENIKAMMGTSTTNLFSNSVKTLLLNSNKLEKEIITSPKTSYIPDSFDSRNEWGSYISEIADQKKCGAGWAFATTSSFSDRLAIATKGEVKGALSYEYMVSCDTIDEGCTNGLPYGSWTFLSVNGVPTEKCVSFKSGEGEVQTCPSKCDDGSDIKLFKAKNISSIRGSKAFKEEIIKNGPIPYNVLVYEDLLSYKSGVYKHVSGKYIGVHTARLIGWGIDPEVGKYWIIANSWGTNWGEKGYFKIIDSEKLVEEVAIIGDVLLDGLTNE